MKLGLFDLMDQGIASELGVDVETYIKVIDYKCTEEESEQIIMAALSNDAQKLEEAKALFNSYLDGK